MQYLLQPAGCGLVLAIRLYTVGGGQRKVRIIKRGEREEMGSGDNWSNEVDMTKHHENKSQTEDDQQSEYWTVKSLPLQKHQDMKEKNTERTSSKAPS